MFCGWRLGVIILTLCIDAVDVPLAPSAPESDVMRGISLLYKVMNSDRRKTHGK